MPWKSAIARPNTLRSLAYLTASSNAPSARPSEMLGFRQRCVLKALRSLRKPSSEDEVLRRQLDILEADLVQILAAHRVIGAGAPKSRACRCSTSTQPMPSRPGFLSTRVKTTNMPASSARLIRVLTPLSAELVADMVGIGLVVRDVGAGVGLGHADRQDAIAAAHLRQDAPLDGLGRVRRDDPGLHADFAQHRHRGHVAGLGDLLEDQRGVEHRQAEPAIFLRHRHAEHAELRERASCCPTETCRPCTSGVRLEFILCELAHRVHHGALIVRSVRSSSGFLLGYGDRAAGPLGHTSRLFQQMLIARAHEMFEAAHVCFHRIGGRFAIAPAACVENALVRLDYVRLVAHRVADAVMLAVREDADRLPENLQHLVSARARDDAVEDAVLFYERLLVALRVERFHAHDRGLELLEVLFASVDGRLVRERRLDHFARLDHRYERDFVQA